MSNTKSWLVTGGAGYIGSHLVRALLGEGGRKVVVLDDLSSGKLDRLPFLTFPEIAFIQGSITDKVLLESIFIENSFLGVIHLAALKDVAKSSLEPGAFQDINVKGTLNLVELCVKFGVENFLFSSTVAVYDEAFKPPYAENSGLNPKSYYGHTKLESEKILNQASLVGMNNVVFRFFNVVGAASKSLIDVDSQNLFSKLQFAIGNDETFSLYGTNLETKDGTCIRDYIHVLDIVAALMECILLTESGRKLNVTMNLGSGTGISVREVISKFQEISGRKLDVQILMKRNEDPLISVADTTLAFNLMGWEPKHDLDEMVRSSLAVNQ